MSFQLLLVGLLPRRPLSGCVEAGWGRMAEMWLECRFLLMEGACAPPHPPASAGVPWVLTHHSLDTAVPSWAPLGHYEGPKSGFLVQCLSQAS